MNHNVMLAEVLVIFPVSVPMVLRRAAEDVGVDHLVTVEVVLLVAIRAHGRTKNAGCVAGRITLRAIVTTGPIKMIEKTSNPSLHIDP